MVSKRSWTNSCDIVSLCHPSNVFGMRDRSLSVTLDAPKEIRTLIERYTLKDSFYIRRVCGWARNLCKASGSSGIYSFQLAVSRGWPPIEINNELTWNMGWVPGGNRFHSLARYHKRGVCIDWFSITNAIKVCLKGLVLETPFVKGIFLREENTVPSYYFYIPELSIGYKIKIYEEGR